MSEENDFDQGQKERVGRSVENVKELEKKKFRRSWGGFKYPELRKIDVSSFFVFLNSLQLPRTSFD